MPVLLLEKKLTDFFVPQKLEKNELIQLIPHSGKMVLLSRIISHDISKREVVAQFDVEESCIFYDDELDGIPNWVTFEIMAQTLSSLTGITNRVKGLKPLAGCILSITNFKAEKEVFEKGSVLTINIREDFRDEESHVFKYYCSVSQNGQTDLVTTDITVLETENIESIVKGN